MHDVDEPQQDSHGKAVTHWLRLNIGGDTRFADWSDTQLWKVICENVIVP